jgi:hypothetical protein
VFGFLMRQHDELAAAEAGEGIAIASVRFIVPSMLGDILWQQATDATSP